MLRISKQVDYGIQLLSRCCDEPSSQLHNARDLAAATGLPLPMVSKVLKRLAREGILVSLRGTKGGYTLAHDPRELSVAAIIRALEGPLKLLDCATEDPEPCRYYDSCQVISPMRSLALSIRGLFERITLYELTHPASPPHPPSPASPNGHQS